MGKMKVVAQLVAEGDKEMLVDYLLNSCHLVEKKVLSKWLKNYL